MPCGKKPLVKSWDRPKDIRTVKPSRYQQNEASVKVHWKNVIKDIELFYKDEQFWETQGKTVRDLVGPVIFERLVKIFNLQIDDDPYVPPSEPSTIQSSDKYYATYMPSTVSRQDKSQFEMRPSYSLSDFEPEEIGEEDEEREDEDTWSTSSEDETIGGGGGGVQTNRSITRSMMGHSMNRSVNKSLNQYVFKSFSKVFSTMSRTFNKSFQRSFSSRRFESSSSWDMSAASDDDIIVHPKSVVHTRKRGGQKLVNPHFELLYCNDSETDMIKWNSHYKQKKFEVSASDEYSKKAELLTKQIAHDFYEWWVGLGSVEFKTEIKRPVDIEDLFQVWFDEHASRGLVLDPKILPCVLQNIANYVGAPRTSCPRVLKRQIASDIHAETKPAHTLAFGQCLPLHMKHIPPQNNTKEIWHSVKIPEDLRSMAAVWEDISHLTATKAFMKWLTQHPYMPMPPYLKELGGAGEKKQLFVIPSDFVVRDKSIESFSNQDLNIPVSQFSLEIKEVLSRLLND
ncbi:uncharacterized protein LOC126366402 [Pectinophora gossypiella]|uniref:uncharacterized protein LOC126366402 n=1 Tax=Pectinophora gossypiella TaxID=13191 RepID=UPI00214EEA4B|nr:uncharacterized protein LOC126366402 [Pectinophora gossypiella]